MLQTVKGWRFRVTKNGKPAWIYNVFQEIDFDIPDSNQRLYIVSQWLCKQPHTSAVLVKPEREQKKKYVLMANYEGERVAYLPTNSVRKLANGSATVQFCIEANGSLVKPRVEETSGDRLYGALAVQVLRSTQFRPLFIDGRGKRVCGVVRKIHFVTKWPQNIPPATICGCQKYPLHIVRLRASRATESTRTNTAATMRLDGGDARLQLCLSAAGRVTKATFLRKGSTSLDSAAMRAVNDLRFFAQRNDSGKAIGSCGWQIWATGSRSKTKRQETRNSRR